MWWPSGENATDKTRLVCPLNGPATVSPVVAFHTQIVRSSEPETMWWPSGENATELTESLCPVKGPATISPVVAFHTRIVRSFEPETTWWPSDENATHLASPPTFETTISHDGQ